MHCSGESFRPASCSQRLWCCAVELVYLFRHGESLPQYHVFRGNHPT